MSESVEPPVLDSGNSDSNSEREASPAVTEDTLVESVVKIVNNTNSNLSEDSITIHDNASSLKFKGELLCHSASDGDIYKESKSKVKAPKNIRYTRSGSGFTDVIGNKVVTGNTKLNGVSHKDTELYQYWMRKTPKEIESILKKGSSMHSLYGDSGTSMHRFGESGSNERSNNSDPSEISESFEPRGFDLSHFNSAYFSIPSTEEDEREHSSD